jgi:hypothetical protein
MGALCDKDNEGNIDLSKRDGIIRNIGEIIVDEKSPNFGDIGPEHFWTVGCSKSGEFRIYNNAESSVADELTRKYFKSKEITYKHDRTVHDVHYLALIK